MPVDRMLPSPEAEDLLTLTREIAAVELAPRAAAAEESGTFPRAMFTLLGRSGLLSLPYPESSGGGGQPFETYLQVLEELGSAWMTVAVGVSVHSLSCYPLARFGTPEQQAALLPGLLAGDRLGRLLPVRGPGRVRRLGHRDPGAPLGRRLAAQRQQGLDHPRRGRPTSTPSSPGPTTIRPTGCPASWSMPAVKVSPSVRRSARWA